MTDKEKIYDIVKRVTALLGYDLEPTFKETLQEEREKDLVCALSTKEESQFLIGHHGANLYALEHIIHSIARTQGITSRFRLDVNDYRESKKQMFVRIAEDAARDAARNKKPVVLRPMNAYERRLIHTTLADVRTVTTESIGEGENRKIVVKPEGVMSGI